MKYIDRQTGREHQYGFYRQQPAHLRYAEWECAEYVVPTPIGSMLLLCAWLLLCGVSGWLTWHRSEHAPVVSAERPVFYPVTKCYTKHAGGDVVCFKVLEGSKWWYYRKALTTANVRSAACRAMSYL